MKSIGFDIVLDDSKVLAAVKALKAELGSISGVAKDIRVNLDKKDMAALRKQLRDSLSVKVNVGITDSKLKNLKAAGVELNRGIMDAAANMELFLVKLREAERLSKKVGSNLSGGVGGVGGGNSVNSGSRTGIGDPGSTRSQLSAFSGFIRGGQSFTSQIGAYASGFGRLGLAIGLPIAVIANLVRGLGLAVGQVREFGKVNAELAGVLGTSREGIGDLTRQAIQLGRDMSYTSTQITSAQVELAKIGLVKDEILSSTEAVARFALVTGAAIPDAASAAGAALNSFELDAEEMNRVVSVMGVGINKSALDFEKMKVGIGTTFATAKTFGLEIEDITALLGELSNRGLSASVAATATRNLLLNFGDEKGDLRKTLKGLGVDDVKGLDGILKALRVLNNEGIDLATTFELTDKRSVNAFNAFLRGTDSVLEMRNGLRDVNEEFKVMESERLNSLDGSILLYQSAVERLNLTLSNNAGVENLLRAPLDVMSSLMNSFSDAIEDDIGDVIAKEGYVATNLVESLMRGNLSYELRSKIIAKLKLQYPDLVEGINLESASTSRLRDLLSEINDLYENKVSIATGNDAFKRAVDAENEALSKQLDLLSRGDKYIFGKRLQVTNTSYGEDAKIAQGDAINAIRNQFTEGGTITTEQAEYLRKVIGEVKKGRGVKDAVGDENQERAKVLLREFVELQASVRSYRQFAEEDFRSVTAAGLSEADRYINELEKKKKILDKKYGTSSAQSREVADNIQNVKDQQEARRKDVETADEKRKRLASERAAKSAKADPLEGSIDFLEKRYNDLIKKIESVPTDGERIVLQRKSEEAKVLLDDARDAVKARAKITDDEQLRADKNLFEAQRFEADKNAKKIIDDEKLLEKVLTRNKLEEQLRGLGAEERLLKERFDKGLDKVGEYEAKKIEIEQKAEEIRLNNIAIGLRGFAVLKEAEYRENVKSAENIIKNEEDRKTYIELLTLQLSKFRIEQEKRFGKDYTDEQKKQLADIEKQTKEKLILLGTTYEGITPELVNTSGTGTREAAANDRFIRGAIKSGEGLIGKNLSVDEYEKYQNEIKDLDVRRLIEVATIERDKTEEGTDARRAAEYELQKLKIDHQQELADRKASDLKKEQEETEKVWASIKKAADGIGKVSSKYFDYQRTQLEGRIDSELESIDTVYKARLEAVKGNDAETARLEAEYASKKKAAEKKAAEERRQLALKEAYIQLALGIIEAAPNAALMAVAAIVGGIQIGIIQKQKFKHGGFTPKGNGQIDETGSVPVGIVHNDEYVAPTKQIRKYPELFRFLDSDRKKFASGGFTSSVPLGGASMGITEQQIIMMAEVIASRTAESVGNAAYSATYGGTKSGAKDGIIKVNRENESRRNSVKVNTF